MEDSYTVLHAAPSHMEQWAAYANGHPDATVMHHPAWRAVLREAFSVEDRFLVAEDGDGRIVGVLPAYFSRSPVWGPHLAALDGGPLADDTGIAAALGAHALQAAREKGACFINLKNDMALEDLPSTKMECVWPYLPLADGPEAILASLHKKTRWTIRQGPRNGLSVEEAPDGIDEFYAVFSRRMKELGTPVVPYAMFTSMRRNFGSDMRLFLVRQGARCLGGMVCIRHGGDWHSLQAATDMGSKNLFPNYTLYWSVIEHACADGAGRFHFGRSAPNSGTAQFKHKWTRESLATTYRVHKLTSKCPDFGKIHSKNTLSQRLWMKMPVGLTNIVGPLIRRRLPFL